MTETDSKQLLAWLDSALDVFRLNEGLLSAREIRILSMLSVARAELAAELDRAREPRLT